MPRPVNGNLSISFFFLSIVALATLEIANDPRILGTFKYHRSWLARLELHVKFESRV